MKYPLNNRIKIKTLKVNFLLKTIFIDEDDPEE